MHSFIVALLYAAAMKIQPAQIQLRRGVTVDSSSFVPFDRLGHIPEAIGTGLIQIGEIILCAGMSAVGRPLVPSHCLVLTFVDSQPRLVERAKFILGVWIPGISLVREGL